MKTHYLLTLLFISSFLFLLILWRLPVKPSQKISEFQKKKDKNLFAQKIDQVLPEPQASLLNGMVWGYKSFLPYDFYQALKKTGTLHIVVLSGMNVTILVNLIAKFTYLLGRRLASLSTVLLISLFVLFVGAEPPIVRAAIMGSVTMIAVFFGRQDWSLLTLFIAAGLMLVVKPEWLFSLSFQLSFLASLGIILLAPRKEEIKVYRGKSLILKTLDDLKRGFAEDFRTTLSAQIFTLPVIFYNFGQLSLAAPLTNVLVGWLVPLITPLGIFLGILGLVFKPIANILGLILWVPLSYFIFVVEATSKIPFAFLKF